MTGTQTARPALRFLSADTTTGVVAYAVPSQHDAGRINLVSLDTRTGATDCSCKASTCGKTCWHHQAVREAWDREPAHRLVIWLTDAQLARYGQRARHMVETYQARIARSRTEDRVALLAARGEYRRRVRLGLIERATVAAAA